MISISVIIGVSLGLLVRGGLHIQILRQLTLVMGLQVLGVPAATAINNLIIFFGCFAVITFFIFSRWAAEFTPVKAVSRLGRSLMYFASGVLFATGYAFTITMALNSLQSFIATYPGQYGIPIFAVMVIILL